MFSCCKRLSSELGAASIEALGTMIVFLLALLLALVMGVSFYNLSIMNSAAQNITLNTQVQLDRYCSPQPTPDCLSLGIPAANSMRAAVIQQTEQVLAYAGPIEGNINGASCSGEGTGVPCSSASNALYSKRPQSTQVPRPSSPASGGQIITDMPRGWGYNTVELKATQELLGGGVNSLLPGLGGGLSLGSRAMSFSYKDPDN